MVNYGVCFSSVACLRWRRGNRPLLNSVGWSTSMYIIVDDRNMVAGGYANGFDREGVSSAGIEASEFREWIGKISDSDMHAVGALVISDRNEGGGRSGLIRERSTAPVLCLNERHSLDDTL